MSDNQDVVELKLRDQTYDIQPLSLDAVEKIWPLLGKAKEDKDKGHEMAPNEVIDYACGVLSVAILDSYPESGMTKEVTKKAATFRDIGMIQSKIAEILRKAGLSSGEPQAPAEVATKPSTGISEASTQS